jgi:hypothetical protein
MERVRSDFEHLSQDRLRALVGAGIELNSELSLEGVLARIVESAARLTGARHALLEVAAQSAEIPERVVAYGMSDSDGALPELVPGAAGNLSAPILIRGAVFGNLQLGNKRSGQLFSAEDEELLRALADQAAVAIENARLYEAQAWWTAQLESLNEIGNALVRETDLSRLLELICQRSGCRPVRTSFASPPPPARVAKESSSCESRGGAQSSGRRSSDAVASESTRATIRSWTRRSRSKSASGPDCGCRSSYASAPSA